MHLSPQSIRDAFEEAEDHKKDLADWAAFLRKILPEEYEEREQPERGTFAPPGTTLKVEVMKARIEAGLDPFHPGDLPYAVYRLFLSRKIRRDVGGFVWEAEVDCRSPRDQYEIVNADGDD